MTIAKIGKFSAKLDTVFRSRSCIGAADFRRLKVATLTTLQGGSPLAKSGPSHSFGSIGCDGSFLRWGRVAQSLDAAATSHDIALIDVADREADEFDWLTSVKNRGGRFVVRQTKNRRVKPTVDIRT